MVNVFIMELLWKPVNSFAQDLNHVPVVMSYLQIHPLSTYLIKINLSITWLWLTSKEMSWDGRKMKFTLKTQGKKRVVCFQMTQLVMKNMARPLMVRMKMVQVQKVGRKRIYLPNTLTQDFLLTLIKILRMILNMNECLKVWVKELEVMMI